MWFTCLARIVTQADSTAPVKAKTTPSTSALVFFSTGFSDASIVTFALGSVGSSCVENSAECREMTTTPTVSSVAIMILYSPQWSFSKKMESIIVKAGEEKVIAPKSPSGSCLIASK